MMSERPTVRAVPARRRIVRVDLAERGYDIVIGERLLESAEDVLAPVVDGRRTVVVTDAVVRDSHLPRLARALDGLGIQWDTVTIPVGERAKSFRDLEALLDRLLDGRFENLSAVFAALMLGGSGFESL